RYSGVSGASWRGPQPLVWSNEGWPTTPRTMNRSHWPFRLGYFESSNARAPLIVVNIATLSAAARIELECMAVFPLMATRRGGGEASAERRKQSPALETLMPADSTVAAAHCGTSAHPAGQLTDKRYVRARTIQGRAACRKGRPAEPRPRLFKPIQMLRR